VAQFRGTTGLRVEAAHFVLFGLTKAKGARAARELVGLGFLVEVEGGFDVAVPSNVPPTDHGPDGGDRSTAPVVDVKRPRPTRALSQSPEAIRKRLRRAAASGQVAGHHTAASGQVDAGRPDMSADTSSERPDMSGSSRVSLSDLGDSGFDVSSRISSRSSSFGSSSSSELEARDRASEGAGGRARQAEGRRTDAVRSPDNGDGRPRVRLVDDAGERPMPTPNELPAPGSAPPDFVEPVLAEVHMSEGVRLDAGVTWRSFLDNAHRRRAEGLSAWATAEHFRGWARKDARGGGGARPFAPRGRIVQQDPPGPKAYQVSADDDDWGGPLYGRHSLPPAWAASAASARGADLGAEWSRFTTFSAKRDVPIASSDEAWQTAWESWLANHRPPSRGRRSVVQGGPESGPRMSFDSDEDFPMPPMSTAAGGEGGGS
jgi:hypothetical protein